MSQVASVSDTEDTYLPTYLGIRQCRIRRTLLKASTKDKYPAWLDTEDMYPAMTYVQGTYHEPDPSTSRRRLVSRSEHWQRQRKIGGGSLWLEKCTKGGNCDIEVLAIKRIEITRQQWIGELEAIASEPWKVCLHH